MSRGKFDHRHGLRAPVFYTVTLRRPWVIEQDIPTVRRGKKLPVVLSQDEVAGFLAAVDNLKHAWS
jgi:hypothetical protein